MWTRCFRFGHESISLAAHNTIWKEERQTNKKILENTKRKRGIREDIPMKMNNWFLQLGIYPYSLLEAKMIDHVMLFDKIICGRSGWFEMPFPILWAILLWWLSLSFVMHVVCGWTIPLICWKDSIFFCDLFFFFWLWCWLCDTCLLSSAIRYTLNNTRNIKNIILKCDWDVVGNWLPYRTKESARSFCSLCSK